MEKKTAAQIEAEKKQRAAEIKAAEDAYNAFEINGPEDVKKSFELQKALFELKGADEVKNFDEKMAAINEALETAKTAKDDEIKALRDDLNVTIKAFDQLQTRVKNNPARASQPTERKSFGDLYNEAMAEMFESKQDEIKAFQKDRNATLSIELKTVGNMLLSSNLTGDGVASYGSRQGIIPSQKINFRDLMSTTPSPTGLYVTYRETGTEGAIAVQTEGNSKGQIDYDLTEVKVVSDYIAGFARFSKQMMFQLPFLQSTLQRMLLRDFYKKENSTFFTTVSGALTGSTTTSATVDAEQLLDWIANQLAADYSASYVLVSYQQWARLLKTKPSDYSVPGGVIIDPQGNIRIAGVPVIGASWVTDDKAMIIDSDYLERVETESLRIDFSYEDADNFTKNLITARVECFEDVNLLRTDSGIYADFGNAS